MYKKGVLQRNKCSQNKKTKEDIDRKISVGFSNKVVCNFWESHFIGAVEAEIRLFCLKKLTENEEFVYQFVDSSRLYCDVFQSMNTKRLPIYLDAP